MVDKESLLYRSGDAFLPDAARKILRRYWIGDDYSLFYVNNWSLVHFVSGILTATLMPTNWNPFVVGVVIHTLWEAWQISIGMTRLNLRGVVDIGMDTVWFMTGMWLTVRTLLYRQRSL
jgi:hypothetical protein